jgi:hypothetical protein
VLVTFENCHIFNREPQPFGDKFVPHTNGLFLKVAILSVRVLKGKVSEHFKKGEMIAVSHLC